jgi:uncharacterized protein YuzE
MRGYAAGHAFRSLRIARFGLSSRCQDSAQRVLRSGLHRLNQVKIKYFEDTDTALLKLGSGAPAETRELSEDIYLDLDVDGHIVSFMIAHASKRGDLWSPGA